MTTTTKLTSSSPLAKLVRAVFPEYRGRKIKAATRSTCTMANYWDGGSRVYVKAVELATGKIVEPAEFTANPMNHGAGATFEIPPGVAMIEHSIFCGSDMGLTVVTGPAAELPAAPVALAIEAAS